MDMVAHGKAIAQDNIGNDRQLTNQELVEFSMDLGGRNRHGFWVEMLGETSETDHAMEENRHVVDQNIDLFYRWKNNNGQGATVQHLFNAMDKVGDLKPNLRKVFGRDRTHVIYQHEGGDRVPQDREINQLCQRIGKNQKALFIWLGLDLHDVERHEKEHERNVNNQLAAMFKQWKNKLSDQATINRIIDAMTVVRMDTGTAEAIFFPESNNIL